MAELLLEPVDVEEDSLQRIAIDTFKFKTKINVIVTDMAGTQKQKIDERTILTELMTEVLDARKSALKDHEKQQKKQKKQAIQGQQAAAAGALQPVGAGASSSTAVVGAALPLPPPAVKTDRAEPWDVQVGYGSNEPYETWLDRDHPKDGAFKFAHDILKQKNLAFCGARILPAYKKGGQGSGATESPRPDGNVVPNTKGAWASKRVWSDVRGDYWVLIKDWHAAGDKTKATSSKKGNVSLYLGKANKGSFSLDPLVSKSPQPTQGQPRACPLPQASQKGNGNGNAQFDTCDTGRYASRVALIRRDTF